MGDTQDHVEEHRNEATAALTDEKSRKNGGTLGQLVKRTERKIHKSSRENAQGTDWQTPSAAHQVESIDGIVLKEKQRVTISKPAL